LGVDESQVKVHVVKLDMEQIKKLPNLFADRHTKGVVDVDATLKCRV